MARRAETKPKRPPLTSDRILDAALEMADAVGTESLSMRKLADRLGVKAMSLYNHVQSKDAILDGLVERVMAEVEVPTAATGWREAMHRRASTLHEVLLKHPWAAALTESRMNLGPARLALNNAVVGSLRGGGFSIELAYQAFLLLDSYIYGFTLQEISWPHEPEERKAVAQDVQSSKMMDAYPHLAEIAEHVFSRPTPRTRASAYRDEFNSGLELILDGLEQRRRAAEPEC